MKNKNKFPDVVNTIDVFYKIEAYTRLTKETLGKCFATDVLEITIDSIKKSIISGLAINAALDEYFALLEKAKNPKQAKYIFAHMLKEKKGWTLYKAFKKIMEDYPEESFLNEYDYCKKFLKRRKLS